MKLSDRVRASKLTHALSLLAGAIIAAGVTVAVYPDHHVVVRVGAQQVKPQTVTTTLAGAAKTQLALPPQAQAITAAQQAQAKLPGSDESALNDNVTPSPAKVRQADQAAPPGVPAVPSSVTDAAPATAGCSSAFVGNFSHRAAGAHVELGVIHWTGSTPTLGSPNGGRAIVAWFNNPSSQVSSNYVTDQDGRCWYVVPEALKAWTQVSANSWSVSDEITNIGTAHPLFQTAAARRTVIRLMIGWHHRWGLPYRHARVNSSCVPTRSGFLSHRDLGPCGGGHPDVGDFNLDGLIAQAKAADQPTVSKVDRLRCRRLNKWRAAGRPRRYAHPAVLRKRTLIAHHVICDPGKPARR